MKKIFYLFALCASATVFSQQNRAEPVVIIDGMLASNALITNEKKNIQSTTTYKKTDLPVKLKNFESLAGNGLVSVQVKENYYDKISLKALNGDFNLAPNNPVMFDGHLITDTEIVVLGNVLEQMEVNVVDGKKILSIGTAQKAPSATAIK